MKIYNGNLRNIALAIFFSLTAASLSLYGCGGGGGGGGDGVVPPAPPAAPASVTADAGNGQVTVSWAPVAGATSCNVYQGTTAGITKTTGTKVGTNITTSTYTVTGLANGTTYYFMVTAVNSAGESGGSVVKSATPSATPTAGGTTNVRGAAGAGKASISWDASTGATTYNIYYSTLTGVTKTNGTRITGAVSPMDVTGLTNGTTYFFVVTAVNANGESAESIPVSVTPSASPPPAAPTGVTAISNGNAGVTISWSAVSGATSYNIYWSTTYGVTKANGTKITGAVSPSVVTGLTNGPPYFFVVTAVNANGESAESTEVSPPAAPTGVTATAGNGQVTISWSAVSGATSYNIYWSTTSGVTKTNSTMITGASSPYTHTNRTNGTIYYYIVTTVNSSGESNRSAEVSAIPSPASPPAPPIGVTATPGDGQVIVSWTAAAGATSYNIYWSTTSGVTKTNGTKITGVSSPYTHTSRTNGTTYYYVVTALIPAGESGEVGSGIGDTDRNDSPLADDCCNFRQGRGRMGNQSAVYRDRELQRRVNKKPDSLGSVEFHIPGGGDRGCHRHRDHERNRQYDNPSGLGFHHRFRHVDRYFPRALSVEECRAQRPIRSPWHLGTVLFRRSHSELGPVRFVGGQHRLAGNLAPARQDEGDGSKHHYL